MNKTKITQEYGNYIQIPYEWFKLCKKYEIRNGKEVKINPIEICLLSHLAGYKEDCYPTNESLAKVLNTSKSSIEKYIKELRWVGFIKTYERKDENSYTIKRYIYVQDDVIRTEIEKTDDQKSSVEK